MPDIFTDPQPNDTPIPSPHPDTDALNSVAALMQTKSKNMGIFSAYGFHPRGVTFASQESDEVIILFLRRHFITNVPWILATLLLIIVPPILFVLAQLLTIFPFSLPVGLTTVVALFYYLIVGSYAFSQFVSWFYNIGVVTQKRIVDLDTTNILAHNTAAANFSEIVDVKYTQQGFFQSFFNYGDILIQTEAIHANFEFDKAPRPTDVTDMISDLRVAQRGIHHGIS